VRRRNSFTPEWNLLRGSFGASITRTAGAPALVVLVSFLATSGGTSAGQAPALFVNRTAFVPQYGRPDDAATLAVCERLGPVAAAS